MLRMKAGFGNDYCDGFLNSDGSSCSVTIYYKDGNSVFVESTGVEVKELVRYLVKVASEPRVKVKTNLGKMMKEMLNALFEGPRFTIVSRDDVYVESVAEEDGMTYTISFATESFCTYTVENIESDKFVEMTFSPALPLRFNKFIETLNIEEE